MLVLGTLSVVWKVNVMVLLLAVHLDSAIVMKSAMHLVTAVVILKRLTVQEQVILHHVCVIYTCTYTMNLIP